MNNKTIIVDSDAIIATIHPSDSNHDLAVSIRNHLEKNDYQLLYPATTIAESITVIQRVLGDTNLSKRIAELFANNNEQIIKINSNIISESIQNYFTQTASKKNTLFDCIVAQCAKKHGTNHIFSFDSFYRKNGFTCGKEILN